MAREMERVRIGACGNCQSVIDRHRMHLPHRIARIAECASRSDLPVGHFSGQRALRDGTDDSLTVEVAGRIPSEEERHVPFHCARLHASLAELPRAVRRPMTALRQLLLLAISRVVAADHGPALRRLGAGRPRFVVAVVRSSGPVVSSAPVPRPDARVSGRRPRRGSPAPRAPASTMPPWTKRPCVIRPT